MTRNELFTSLNKLCKDLDADYNINSGGCCFVAACLAEQLEKHNIPFKISICESPTHYWIKVSDRSINRSNFVSECIENLTSKFLYDLYYDEIWNDLYSKKWNLIVKTKIISLFNKYGNSRKRFHNKTFRR